MRHFQTRSNFYLKHLRIKEFKQLSEIETRLEMNLFFTQKD